MGRVKEHNRKISNDRVKKERKQNINSSRGK